MAISAQQETFGDAFLLAVAAVAGCAAARPRPDYDSIDWTLSCRLPRRPKLDVQMKTTVIDAGTDNTIRYSLRKKNYDDLRVTDLSTPRILVVVILPNETEDWLHLTEQQLVLKRCAYWVSLAGEADSRTEHSVTVSIPRENLLTPNILQEMMFVIDRGGTL